MSTTTTMPIQIRVDRETRNQANELFKALGTDMTGAVNLFLKQCVLTNSIPLKLRRPQYSRETLDAMAEAKRISHDPSAPHYHTVAEFREAMEAE